MKRLLFLFLMVFIISCEQTSTVQNLSITDCESYLNNSGSDDRALGGIKMIPINTPKGEFKVWTKRVGHNPTKKVLLLHGGPGMTHEIYESFDGYFPQENIE